ncbi:xanthine dehydrogenase accessory protein XdhC [Paenirhodobacter populi]|uniref:xanthine dehydrogenase accessory protein XdhC n=1 Tax=Paenirhodobacter populi TaxID=2306993 RepID=UPI000FE38EFB|nr:xanthine dehydrogenase accessory protein XdhC [Sinirhodobacter populi]RWR10845.1 xanthine dehydrogenase accessory protein XdhC [Sinirhodobacter populi]
MSIDPGALARARSRGPFVRVVVAEVRGSAPREPGAAMLVWPDRVEGTIGGGRLEYEAIARARATHAPRLERIALGPAMGQCCGGAVALAYEPSAGFAALEPGWHARPLDGGAQMPMSVRRALARARDRGERPAMLLDGWLIEEVARTPDELWIWGAGHVGRALVDVLSPLPDLRICWADTDAARFPESLPDPVTPLIAENPADLVSLAPVTARHLILTYSHALDLELCHRLLTRGFAACGLIGSATKWARFRHRLRDLGHTDAQILRIACPIGDPTLGKAPQAIAISVGAALLRDLCASRADQAAAREERTA